MPLALSIVTRACPSAGLPLALEEARAHTLNLSPSRPGAQAALNADDPKRALELLDEMDAEGIAPTTISFNTAISACTKTADWERALELFRRMETEGVERSTITYTGLINACAAPPLPFHHK